MHSLCNRCGRCDVAVSSMRSLCHLNNRYAIVPLVTYSLIYRNPNDLWKVRLGRFPHLRSCAATVVVRSEIWERALFKEFQAFWGKSGLPTVLE